MNFNGGSSVKLSGIKSYNTSAKANTVFKKQFYDEIDEIDYSQYEEIDYNDNIDLEKSIEAVKLEEKKLEESKEKAKVELEEKTKKKEKKKKQWYETALDYTGTFIGSVVEGFLDLGEGLVDGTIYGVAKTLQAFGIDDKWAEDAIAYDVSGNLYDVYVDATGIDKDIAYGKAHSAGNFVGEMVGYYALSCVPYAGPALCAVAGAGSAVEDSINEQKANGGEVNDWKVFGASALGALEGYGFGKAASGLKAGAKAVTSGSLKKAAGGVTKETIKTTIKTQGKQIAKNAAIKTVTEGDTYVEIGSVLADDVVNGIETGEWDWQRMAGETAVTLGENYAGNLLGGFAEGVVNTKIKSDFDDIYMNGELISNQHIIKDMNIYENIKIQAIYDDLVNKGLISPTEISIDEIEKLFKESGKIEIDGIMLDISNEEAIKRTLLELYESGSGGGKTSSELFKKFNLSLDTPERSSLSTLESRVWYLESEKSIKPSLEEYKKENPNITIEEQAEFCFNERNRLRREARDAMSNDEMRKYLDSTENTGPFEDFFEYKKLKSIKESKYISDEQVYQDIINGSDQSRTALNRLLGIGKEEK